MAKNYTSEDNGGINVIAGGTTFIGEITTNSDFRIDGTVKGNINSTAKICVGSQGSIEGEVKCVAMNIEGNVRANVETKDILEIQATATMVGNVLVDKISIEPGAKFMGTCKMQNVKEKAPAPIQ